VAESDAEQADLSEPLALIRLMGRLGLDYVNLSGHDTAPRNAGELLPEERACGMLWYERLAAGLVHAERLALCVMGSGYSALGAGAAAIAAARIRAGHAHLAGFGRQTFADPLYPEKLRRGEAVGYCRHCGACATLMRNHRRAGCVVHDPYYRDELRAFRRGA
jgi:2,4-dienoyl-CoA reductase-like NADH-dependent reductase (Old Yellow Enzyme family)